MNGTPASPRPSRAPNGRSLAARVLRRVFADGAYAAAALAAELGRHAQLDGRERGLATELVYGVLRTHRALAKRLAAYTPRGIRDEVTRIELLLAAYQLLLLDRIPAFAAVDSAVDAVRAERGARVAAFANAVLRKFAREQARIPLAQAIRENVPDWLFERLVEATSEAEALAVLGAGEIGPGIGIRLSRGHDAFAADWLTDAARGRVCADARRIERVGDPRRLSGYTEGAFVVQEEGAQAVALLLGARPGERVLDACAGRGQKTSLLAERVGESGSVVAADLYPEKLSALRTEFTRLGLKEPETQAVDWTVGAGGVAAGFDRVLVDAPCSGTGTLRHRPEILERLTPEDPARLGELAGQILRSAASRARPGGSVVFAVCSLLKEEAEAVLPRVADLLEPAPFDAPELAATLDLGRTSLRLLPLAHGTDGYFVASFRRRS